MSPSLLRGPVVHTRPDPKELVARTSLDWVLRRVPVRAHERGGAVLGREWGRPVPVIDLLRPQDFYRRLADHPKLAVGEGYMAGEWAPAQGHDLAEVLRPFAAQVGSLAPGLWRTVRRVTERARHRRGTDANTLDGARANIEAHYDLSNELFATFLDPTLSYSSARFDPTRPFAEQGLREAQERKIEAALDLAGVGAGSRVLEIGTGWGSLAIAAGRRGAQVVSVTISSEQLALARQRVREAGLEHEVEIRLQDYREVRGQFDAIVSIEMIEAVGEHYWPSYFGAMDRLLAPGGAIALQAILMSHERLLATRGSASWINAYIFPGGIMPSLTAIEQVTGRHTTLEVTERQHFGRHYAETLQRWRATFVQQRDRVHELGFDETFVRMWEFYLAYCEAGFAVDYIDVAQLQLRRPGG